VLLQWIILCIAVAALLAISTEVVTTSLGRLMALSLAPLLGFEFLNLDGKLRPYQASIAATLAGASMVAAVALGASGSGIFLQVAIIVSSLFVVAGVALRIRDMEQLLCAADHAKAAAGQRAADADAHRLRLGGAVHDINNLLTVICGSAEMVQIRGPGTSTRDTERLLRATEKAQLLGRSLLAASRAQSPLPTPINLNGVLQELRPVLEQLASPATVLCVGTENPLIVNVPPGAIDQILLNLLSNAAQAQSQVITVRLRRWDDMAWVEVVDDGVGMSSLVVKKAKQLFFTTRSEAEGTGMGLYTVSEIARKSRGRVDINSRKGVGTCVSVAIPILQ
jgi:signal transduction histidine kinase